MAKKTTREEFHTIIILKQANWGTHLGTRLGGFTKRTRVTTGVKLKEIMVKVSIREECRRKIRYLKLAYSNLTRSCCDPNFG